MEFIGIPPYYRPVVIHHISASTYLYFSIHLLSSESFRTTLPVAVEENRINLYACWIRSETISNEITAQFDVQ